MSVIKVFAPKQKELKVAKITPEDIEEIARWCGGKVREDLDAPKKVNYNGHSQYIDVPVDYRLVRADVGDYIATTGISDSVTIIPANLFEIYFEEI